MPLAFWFTPSSTVLQIRSLSTAWQSACRTRRSLNGAKPRWLKAA